MSLRSGGYQRRWAWIPAALVVWMVAAGCGVPGSSRPVERGLAPQLSNLAEQPVAPEPPGPDSASSASELVQFYLQQAAWGNAQGQDRPDALNDAVKRVRRYLVSDSADAWQPGTGGGVTLVRVSLGAPVEVAGQVGAFTLDARIEPVGVLGTNGAVEPPPSTDPFQYQFKVVGAGGGRFRLVQVPNTLMFDVDELNDWYEPRMIYFWSDAGSERVLVPDRRYMAKAVTPEKRPGEVFEWLREGPSSLLKPVVQALPAAIKLRNRLAPADPLTINLSAEAAGPSNQELQDFVTQIRWSLRPSTTPVELTVADQRRDLDGRSDKYLSRNPAAWTDTAEPDKFCVVDGKARSCAVNPGGGPRLLRDDEANRDVVSAAITGSGEAQQGAFVRADAKGQRLWLAAMSGSGEVRSAVYRPTDIVGRQLSRPVWLARGERRVLLAVDGRLVTVGPDGATAAYMGRDLGPVTAVATAPDGRRVAMIAGGGQAYVASARLEGGTLFIGDSVRPLTTGLVTAAGIGWTREDRILVGGTAAHGSPMVEVSVDGTRRMPIERANLANFKITQLVAYPDDAIRSGERILAMFQANDQAYDVFGQGVGPIQPEPTSTPSPGPSVTPAARVSVVHAPFFRE